MNLGALVEDSRKVSSAWRKIEITGLTADSREVAPGHLFAAIAGVRADGARFIPDACRRGAAAVLVGPQISGAATLGVPMIRVDNPRRALAVAAARFYARQPEIMAAVTGTNGKTSVASFLRQIWRRAGHAAASIGTVGVVVDGAMRALQHTTPDPVALHRLLRDLADEGVTHAAMEASSHGLAQYRIDGVQFSAAGFTNVSRDHLDYHETFNEYFAQKLRLFTQVLANGATAVVNADASHAATVVEAARKRGIACLTVGERGEALKLVSHDRADLGQALTVVDAQGDKHHVTLPLVGDFQTANALLAAGLAIATGIPAGEAMDALGTLEGAKGRLEKVGETSEGAAVFVDYAHTPDALKTVLRTLRPYTKRRLIVVFGAGGDRDQGKRPQMGKIASTLADIAIVTDDNPRSEDAAAIRAEILATAPQAIEIGDRRTAVAAGVRMLRAGDVLLVAGKGHEAGQIIGEEIIPFSDHEAVLAALEQVGARA